MLFETKNLTVLFFGTHPDDIEIGAGGTALLLSEKGNKLHYAIFTSGEEGANDTSKDSLVKIREKEALDAASFVGAQDVHFFRYPDGLTGFTKDMKVEVIQFLKRIKPDIIFTHSSNDQNPDHQVCAKLVRDALAASQGPWYPETEKFEVSPKLVLGYEVWTPTQSPQTSVDIASVLDKKMQLVSLFKSQVKDIQYDKAVEGLAHYRSLLNKHNRPCEAFQVIQIKLD